jgi:CRP-like cAMP-binding protein
MYAVSRAESRGKIAVTTNSDEISVSKTPADEFNNLWDAPPDVNAFLAELPDATPRERADVVAVDLFRRWRVGNPAPLESYFESIPEVADDVELKFELVLREFEYQGLYGEAATVDEFVERFPDLGDRLRQELGCNQDESIAIAVADNGSVDTTIIAGDSLNATSLSDTVIPDVEVGGAPFLAECETFTSLPANVLSMIESNMFCHSFSAGETVLKQGEPGTSLLVIRNGIVEISTEDKAAVSHFIGRIGTGQVLGEMSLLTEEPRTANVVATTDVEVLVLPSGIFHELASLYPSISVVLTRLFATRLGGVGRDVLAGKTFGGYCFTRHLGQGGMGVVYEARHVETDRQVALKMMSHRLVYDSEALMQFQREADIIETFEHPNIVTTYGRFAAFHTYFIAMQFCDGFTLEDVVNATGPLPEAEFRKIIGQVAAALDHAHAHKIIHRDVKPANIMLNRDGSVKLMDFGLAKPVEDETGGAAVSIVGTPRYMAPEQLAGFEVGKEADYFALGCVAYKALTGQTLFTGGGVREIRREHHRYQMPKFREVCPGISIATNWLLEQCLERDLRQRRPNIQKIASWASPFDPDLLAAVDERASSQLSSEETYFE